MSVDAFDTNILVYYFDETDQRKSAIARRLVRDALTSGDVVISYQVVQETLNVLTTKLRTRLTAAEVAGLLDLVLVPLWGVMPNQQLYERALRVRSRYGLSFYDSLVVAGALQAACTRLLSEDLQHGQVVDGLTIENPFLV